MGNRNTKCISTNTNENVNNAEPKVVESTNVRDKGAPTTDEYLYTWESTTPESRIATLKVSKGGEVRTYLTYRSKQQQVMDWRSGTKFYKNNIVAVCGKDSQIWALCMKDHMANPTNRPKLYDIYRDLVSICEVQVLPILNIHFSEENISRLILKYAFGNDGNEYWWNGCSSTIWINNNNNNNKNMGQSFGGKRNDIYKSIGKCGNLVHGCYSNFCEKCAREKLEMNNSNKNNIFNLFRKNKENKGNDTVSSDDNQASGQVDVNAGSIVTFYKDVHYEFTVDDKDFEKQDSNNNNNNDNDSNDGIIHLDRVETVGIRTIASDGNNKNVATVKNVTNNVNNNGNDVVKENRNNEKDSNNGENKDEKDEDEMKKKNDEDEDADEDEIRQQYLQKKDNVFFETNILLASEALKLQIVKLLHRNFNQSMKDLIQECVFPTNKVNTNTNKDTNGDASVDYYPNVVCKKMNNLAIGEVHVWYLYKRWTGINSNSTGDDDEMNDSNKIVICGLIWRKVETFSTKMFEILFLSSLENVRHSNYGAFMANQIKLYCRQNCFDLISVAAVPQQGIGFWKKNGFEKYTKSNLDEEKIEQFANKFKLQMKTMNYQYQFSQCVYGRDEIKYYLLHNMLVFKDTPLMAVALT